MKLKYALILVLCTLTLIANAEEGVSLRGFTDGSLVYDKTSEVSSFQLGGVDFFLTKNLDSKTSFLVELVFENNDRGELKTDLERVFLTYNLNPWLKISGGRFHTALGYWNEGYHHGGYLHTSVKRPLMMRFEDDGGILPLHTIGIEFSGNGSVSSGNLGYRIDIGNGRGITNDPPQTASDGEKSKAISGLLFYESPEGLRFGITAYHDNAPGGIVKTQAADPLDSNRVVETSTAVDALSENIFGAHLVYNSARVEFLSEYFSISHNYKNNAKTEVKIAAIYAQLGIHVGLLTPYYRYEINDPEQPDTYSSLIARKIAHTGGIRYEIADTSALKFEIEDVSYNSTNNSTGAINWSYSW